MSEREDAALLRLAQSVVDGEAVDWAAASVSGEASLDRLHRLQILASIATACAMPPDRVTDTAKTSTADGAVLFRWGHLEIREKIGEGTFGEVFRAWETTLEREVAVKFLRADRGSLVVPFAVHALQEGRNLARIRHPSVVTVYGAEQFDGRIGIWMEFLRGRTLEQILQAQGPFEVREAITIGIDLCRALAAVHEAGLVHRDMKTRNIVREGNGRIVLTDFGTGIDLQADGTLPAPILAGTPAYLAPEILQGQPASLRSDLYSLGVLLYRLVTQSYPMDTGDFDALRDAHARGDRKPLIEARADLPASFVQVVEKALAATPADRFASASEMEEALVAAAAPPHVAAPRRSTIRANLLGATAIAAILGLSAFVALRHFRGDARPAGRLSIAVADVVNDTREADLDGLSSMLSTALEQSRGLSVLTRSRMQDIREQIGPEGVDRIDESLGREICRHAGVGMLLLPSIAKLGDVYALDLKVLDTRRNEYIFTGQEQTRDKARIPALIDALAARARARLKESPDDIQATTRPAAVLTTTNLAAFHHYEQGERLIDRLDMKSARAALEAAVAEDSTFGLAHTRLAYVSWWLNDSKSEKKHLDAAFSLIDRIPEKERFLLRAQGAMADRQGMEAARAILLEMERFYPDDKEMLYGIGDLSSHLSEYRAAVQYLERVVAMDADFDRALQHLARVYRDLGRPQEMRVWAERFASRDSTGESRQLLGTAQVATGDFAAGMATLLHGRGLSPDRIEEFTMSIARAQLEHGSGDEAVAEWTRFIHGQRSLAARRAGHYERALALAYRGKLQAAFADLQLSGEIARQEGNPGGEATARRDAAFYWLLAENDVRRAFDEMDATATLAPSITYRDTYFSYWIYWGGLFKMYLLSGRWAEAEALAAEKFDADKWYGPYVAAYLHAAKGECAQAEATATGILEWGPAAENIELLYFMAKCQRDAGRLDAAVESLRKLRALRSNLALGTPFYPKSLVLLGEVHEKRGDAQLAAEAYEQLATLWRDADAQLPDLIEARERLRSLRPPAKR